MHEVPKSILAATDFSETADRAVALARDLARRFAAELHLLHVVVLLDDAHLEGEHRDELERLITTGEKARRTILEGATEESPGITATPHLVRGLAPDEVILESASEIGVDLIVMGTHGRRGLKHLLLGSVAEKVARAQSAPVLTVRADAAINPEGISRILVPYDFSESSAHAARFAGLWARALGAEITLLHVVEPVVYPEFYAVDVVSADLMRHLSERSEEALKKAAEEQLSGLPVATSVEVGRAADTIVHHAEPQHFDLVIMSTRGLSALEHVLLGSVAEAVLRRCRVPLVTICGDQKD
jgi:nucleotide-binding universal stress UspA family protein